MKCQPHIIREEHEKYVELLYGEAGTLEGWKKALERMGISSASWRLRNAGWHVGGRQ